MRRAVGVAVALASLAVTPAACGGDGEGKGGAPAAAPTQTASASESQSRTAPVGTRRHKGKTVKVMGSRFGRILVDGRGHTLYLFTRDQRRSRSRCYGGCAEAWPPLYTRGKPRAGNGVEAGRSEPPGAGTGECR